MHVFHVLLLLTIYLVLYSRVKVKRYLILFIELIKDLQLLFVRYILVVNTLDD